MSGYAQNPSLKSARAADDERTSRAILRLGTPFAERYTVVRLLGIGARATVYEGRDWDGRRVAIKSFPSELARDANAAR